MPVKRSILRNFRTKQRLSSAEFAKQLGIAESTLRSLENGNRAITPECAVEIERATQGALTRQDLRPDLFVSEAA